MRYSTAVIITALAARVQAHGVVTSITGANGVVMPGLSVVDGTPRDCATSKCGAQADTSIIRQNELGTNKASALGRTQGGGPVNAAKAIANFMGTGTAAQKAPAVVQAAVAQAAVAQAAVAQAAVAQSAVAQPAVAQPAVAQPAVAQPASIAKVARQLLGKLRPGAKADATGKAAGGQGTDAQDVEADAAAGHVARGILDNLRAKLGGAAAGGAAGAGGGVLKGILGGGAAGAQGTKTPTGTVEAGVGAAAGAGASTGLPTCAADGTITMTFHQINQDGAGPLKAAVDPTSGGTDPAAFQTAAVTQDVPGIGIGGLSRTTTTDFPIKVQMPAGMICNGNVAGQTGVCIVRVQNSALAGPFGGSAAFVQSPAAKKRALEVKYAGKHFARGMLHGVRSLP